MSANQRINLNAEQLESEAIEVFLKYVERNIPRSSSNTPPQNEGQIKDELDRLLHNDELGGLEEPYSKGKRRLHTGQSLFVVVRKIVLQRGKKLSDLFQEGVDAVDPDYAGSHGIKTKQQTASKRPSYLSAWRFAKPSADSLPGPSVATNTDGLTKLDGAKAGTSGQKRGRVDSDDAEMGGSLLESSRALSSVKSFSWDDERKQSPKKHKLSTAEPSVDSSEQTADDLTDDSEVHAPPERHHTTSGAPQVAHGPRKASSRTPVVITGKEIAEELKDIHTSIVSAATMMVSSDHFALLIPEKKLSNDLRALYHRTFGAKPVERYQIIQEQDRLPAADMLVSLISAWILYNILDTRTPWQKSLMSGLDACELWPSFKAVLEAQSVNLDNTIGKASLRLLETQHFREESLPEHGDRSLDTLSMTIWPQIVCQRENGPTNARRQSVQGWRDRLSRVLNQSFRLRAKIEADPELRFEWLWYNASEPIDSHAMEMMYPCSVGLRVAITISPGLRVQRGESEARIERRAVVWDYGA